MPPPIQSRMQVSAEGLGCLTGSEGGGRVGGARAWGVVSTSPRVVTTCSRFGLPSDRISGSEFTRAARTDGRAQGPEGPSATDRIGASGEAGPARVIVQTASTN